MTDTAGEEVVELLQVLIRNRCVSLETPESSAGNESLNAGVLRAVLEGPGIDSQWYEPVPGRASLITRISGIDPSAPSLALIGHTDVVPADATDGWTHDPFGADLVDGEVWGRGAVDMLNQTAAMALAMRRLANEGFRPTGDLVFWAVPDEECGGRVGAKLLLDTDPALVRTDYALTEVGGAAYRTATGLTIDAQVAEKGAGDITIEVLGTQAHSSLPYKISNPILRAAEIVRRIDSWRPPIRISTAWREWVLAQNFDADLEAALIDEKALDDALERLPPDLVAHSHACTRCTVVPTIVEGGQKPNTIPSRVLLTFSIRPTLGDDVEAILAEFSDLITDLVSPDNVTCSLIPASESPFDTPLWTTLTDVTERLHLGAKLVPGTLAAQTDARWLRPQGVVTYGFGLLSPKVSRSDYWQRFHGVNERIDVESLQLSANAWYEVVRAFLSP